MFKKRILGIPMWMLLIGGLIIFRKKIPAVDKAFESISNMIKPKQA